MIKCIRSFFAPLQGLSYKFLAQQQAATAIEYALIASGISIVIVTAVYAMGGSLSNMYGAVGTAVSSAAANAP